MSVLSESLVAGCIFCGLAVLAEGRARVGWGVAWKETAIFLVLVLLAASGLAALLTAGTIL